MRQRSKTNGHNRSSPWSSHGGRGFFRTFCCFCCRSKKVKAIRVAARLVFAVSPRRALPESFFAAAAPRLAFLTWSCPDDCGYGDDFH